MCMICKNKTYIESKTTHVVDRSDSLIIIRNVPCLECEQCGERFYTDVVAEKLEKIVETAKSLMPEISIFDYNNIA